MNDHTQLAASEERLNFARRRLFDATFASPLQDFNDALDGFQAAAANYVTACRTLRKLPASREVQELADYDPPCPADLPPVPDARGQLLIWPPTAAVRIT